MKTEYKTADVKAVTDRGDGRISAFVMVTGIEDNVKDVIERGAAKKSLEKRIPKGVWSHDWTRPIARTEDVKELPPGHPDLPEKLSNGQPWPKEAGAYKVDTLFNLGSPEGARAYSDVLFFGDQQEWSIGYKVPEGGATIDKKTGVRHIHELDWFEYSPVLFGAMSHARTKMDSTPSVSGAQLAHKALNGVDITDILSELKKWQEEHPFIEVKGMNGDDFEGDEPDEDDINEDEDDPEMDDFDDLDDEDEDEDDEDDDDDDDDDEYKGLTDAEFDAIDADIDSKADFLALVRQTAANLEVIEQKMGDDAEAEFDEYFDEYSDEDDEDDEEEMKTLAAGATVYYEAKAIQYDTASEAVDSIDVPMSREDAQCLVAASEAFDIAVEAKNKQAAEQAALEILSVLEVLSKSYEAGAPAAATVARVISDQLHSLDGDGDEEKVTGDGIEVKAFGGRAHGYPMDSKGLVRGDDGVDAYLVGLDNESLLAVEAYLAVEDADSEMKSLVGYESDMRVFIGEIKRDFTDEKRAKYAKTGIAMKDGSFPIPDADALRRAIKACGRAKNKDEAKAHIMKRAEALGMKDLIPEHWSAKMEVIDLAEFKELFG